MKRKKLRPLGHVLLDLEKVLDEMVIDHDLQWGDVLNLTHGHLVSHLPGGQEQYVDVSDGIAHPTFYYGPQKSDRKDETEES